MLLQYSTLVGCEEHEEISCMTYWVWLQTYSACQLESQWCYVWLRRTPWVWPLKVPASMKQVTRLFETSICADRICQPTGWAEVCGLTKRHEIQFACKSGWKTPMLSYVECVSNWRLHCSDATQILFQSYNQGPPTSRDWHRENRCGQTSELWLFPNIEK